MSGDHLGFATLEASPREVFDQIIGDELKPSVPDRALPLHLQRHIVPQSIVEVYLTVIPCSKSLIVIDRAKEDIKSQINIYAFF